jgi:hypothetical protein
MSIIDQMISGAKSAATAAVDSSRTQTSTAIIQRAVVFELLDNLSLMDYSGGGGSGSEVEEFPDPAPASLQNVSNFEDLFIAPRNSIIVKFVSSGKGRSEETTMVCFPFFSSHFVLPVKVGEQVWIIMETPDNPSKRGYWLSRIHEPLYVEDPNYTHGDRRYDPTTSEGNKTADKDGNEEELTTFPTFHNGMSKEMDDDDEFTLSGKSTYEQVFKESAEVNDFIIEPVPRFTKRPGDMVLQGSHNASIVLGTDRGYKAGDALDREKSNANRADPLEPGRGTIDIVTGRGRIHVNIADLDGGEERDKDPVRCEPRVIKNTTEPLPAEESRGEFYETDKNLTVVREDLTNNKTDGCEGDPDFVNDASRIYMSMKTNPDENFALEYPQCPPAGDANDGADVEPISDAASIILKTDEIRIIARQTGIEAQQDSEMSGDNVPDPPIAGSIKIIKEGIPDDEGGKGRAVIMLQPDGVIMIDGPKIVIGSGIAKGNGEGSQVALGLGATEPVVLGEVLKQKLEAYMDAVSAAFDYASKHVHPTGTGPSGPPTGEQWSAKKSDIDTTKGELSEILSVLAKTL